MRSSFRITKQGDSYKAIINPTKLDTTLEELDSSGLYSINMFNEQFCKDFIEESEWLQNSQNEGSKFLEEQDLSYISLQLLGLADVINQFVLLFIKPIAELCFPSVYTDLQGSTSMLVQHHMVGPQANLNTYFSSNSDIAVTICLGSDSEDCGKERFASVRGSHPHARQDYELKYTYKNKIGQGIIHLGNHLHNYSSATLEGKRFGLNIWAYSGKVRKNYCPCCRHYNRISLNAGTETNCTCQPHFMLMNK
jgi:hypothetical protein